MKQAGERLHNILKKKKWQGKGKVIIWHKGGKNVRFKRN